jgi:hypothetical protein
MSQSSVYFFIGAFRGLKRDKTGTQKRWLFSPGATSLVDIDLLLLGKRENTAWFSWGVKSVNLGFPHVERVRAREWEEGRWGGRKNKMNNEHGNLASTQAATIKRFSLFCSPDYISPLSICSFHFYGKGVSQSSFLSLVNFWAQVRSQCSSAEAAFKHPLQNQPCRENSHGDWQVLQISP